MSPFCLLTPFSGRKSKHHEERGRRVIICFLLQLQFLGVLPGEVRVIATKVTKGGGLVVDGSQQVQVTQDDTYKENG
jgi:hypothetical protein